ncbi:hypothetical protein HG566_06200 [Helicobacter pylori]|uniref:hypothetical protein n=1 Tax=Helicobacter pylori TaxID=210 RepID=UPI001923A9BC|nr:hypothetical protein [Helicobacter pylori]QQW88389.1 hypothetical protein HG566_06200 [Helicobacter pylori]
MTLQQVTKSKEIRNFLEKVMHDNKDLNLYLESGGKHAKLTDGAHFLMIPSSPSDRKSAKNFEKELTEFIKKLRENEITHEEYE